VFPSAACADIVSVRKLTLISLRQSLQDERNFPCSRGSMRLVHDGDIV
jgi:hypothetical protein